MKNSIVLRIVLGLSGMLLSIPGALALLAPVKFAARNAIDLGDNVGELSDYRAMGALMFGAGLATISGAFSSGMRFTSTIISMVAYISITLGRLVSIGIDGMAPDGLVKATVVEGVVALILIFAFVRFRDK